MPPDISGAVNKFLPNNGVVGNVVARVLKNVYQCHSLPLKLVKQVVERALDQSRMMDIKVDSILFEEKLTTYANQLRPRYLTELNNLRKQGKKW